MDSYNTKTKKKLKKNKSKNKLHKIRSKYILKIIFDHLPQKNYLGVINYNKETQKRLKVNIKDYKYYSEKFTPIEIEIKPVQDKFGKFINIENNSDEKFYHIYFNNSKEEIKRYCINKEDKAKSIKIIIDYQVNSLYKLFFNCTCIKSIDFKKFYRINIINMSKMFSRCSSLNEINFYKFNSINVNDMSDMFSGCSSLLAINLSKFNTKNVKNMGDMFYGCRTLEKLNLSNFNTDKVTKMNYMFYDCSSLKELNISNFNFKNVINMNFMFSGCLDELKIRIKAQIKNMEEEAF